MSLANIFCEAEKAILIACEGRLEKVLPYFRAIQIAKKWETCTEHVMFESPPAHSSGQVKFEGVASRSEARFWKGFFGLNWNWPELEKEKKIF